MEDRFSFDSILDEVFSKLKLEKMEIESELKDAAEKEGMTDRLMSLRMRNPVTGETAYMKINRGNKYFGNTTGMFTFLDCEEDVFESFSDVVHDVMENRFAMTARVDDDCCDISYYAVHGIQFLDLMKSLRQSIDGECLERDRYDVYNAYRPIDVYFTLRWITDDPSTDEWWEYYNRRVYLDGCSSRIARRGDDLTFDVGMGGTKPFNDSVEMVAALIWKRLHVMPFMFKDIEKNVDVISKPEEMQAFKFPVVLRIDNGGIYQFKKIEVSAIGMNEEDARTRLQENLTVTFETGQPYKVLPRKSLLENWLEDFFRKKNRK